MTLVVTAPTAKAGALAYLEQAGAAQTALPTTVLDAGSNVQPPGVFWVEDYGAVALPHGSDLDQAAVSLRTKNTAGWNAAIAAALAYYAANPDTGGGTVMCGGGIFLTNGLVGLVSALDLNLGLIIQPTTANTLLISNNYNESTLAFRTTGGNLRELIVNDLVIAGGREGCSLAWLAYSTFNRVWFWGSKTFALLNQAGNGNKFKDCRWNESAQGIRTGVLADAVMFESCEDTIENPDFGEFCGGVILNGGSSVISNPLCHDCEYRGQNYFSYLTNSTVVIAATFLPITASIIVWQGGAQLLGVAGNCLKRFVTLFRAYEVIITGRMQTVVDPPGAGTFVGFIQVVTSGGTVVALNCAALTCVWIGGKTGFFIQDSDNVLRSATVRAQLERYPGNFITALATSAPNLFNPQFQDNYLATRTFNRFTADQCPQVTAQLRIGFGTVTGIGWSSIPDSFVNNPAVQTTDARRPVNGATPNGPTGNGRAIATFSSAASSSLAWPLNAGNNGTSLTGFACWVRQPASGNERIISIGGGTGGATAQKLFLAFDTNQRITVGVYSNATDGRQGTTAPAQFVAGAWVFVRWAYDATQATEALRCKIYVNEVLQALTFTNIGAGGAVTTLPVVTGNAIIGNFNNSAVPVQALNGAIATALYSVAGDVSASDGIELMGLDPPTT